MCWHHPAMFCLITSSKHEFLLKVGGDGIKPRLSSWILSTLKTQPLCLGHQQGKEWIQQQHVHFYIVCSVLALGEKSLSSRTNTDFSHLVGYSSFLQLQFRNFTRISKPNGRIICLAQWVSNLFWCSIFSSIQLHFTRYLEWYMFWLGHSKFSKCTSLITNSF